MSTKKLKMNLLKDLISALELFRNIKLKLRCYKKRSKQDRWRIVQRHKVKQPTHSKNEPNKKNQRIKRVTSLSSYREESLIMSESKRRPKYSSMRLEWSTKNCFRRYRRRRANTNRLFYFFPNLLTSSSSLTQTSSMATKTTVESLKLTSILTST